MIVVIADDLTGATEIGGIGLRFGLKTVVSIKAEVLAANTELLVINTNSRSLKLEDALQVTREVTAKVRALNPQHIFKKIDSALRGYIPQEVTVHLEELGLNSALVVAANPALNRFIVDGIYYVNGIPLHEAGFVTDPEFPAFTADVVHLLSGKDIAVTVRKPGELTNENGLVIGEVAREEDLHVWMKYYQPEIFPVGSGGFFAAFLKGLGYQPQQENFAKRSDLQTPLLLVSGTAHPESAGLYKQLKEQGKPVVYLNKALFGEQTGEWIAEVVALLQQEGTVIITLDPDNTPAFVNPEWLRVKTAELVYMLIAKAGIKELIIEGGATAAEILKELQVTQLTPVQEFSQGVIRMRDESSGIYITTKPGSYRWADEIHPSVL
ncbi:four-carbon acid sugar kinase family protein [Mucilaginibacter sp. RS28]|uniref:Four-carbon acid sugar kinase family protein n=1 Tax=Mucilaginibacter straminoryzae TaxID=2932774 RepID=A0A9X2B9R6_9SPHI|nr:four-carbon acid sugar kinase family protein [Mucilaginibacter straminoryzae]MCJ8210030.1 four-carbon acid sugar kinase family protein [Mucilaginibacter straminoryzae]